MLPRRFSSRVSDFECPYCKQLEPVPDSTSRQNMGPAPSGVEGFSSADSRSGARGREPADARVDQGHFWAYHDLLLANHANRSCGYLKRTQHPATRSRSVRRVPRARKASRRDHCRSRRGAPSGIEATPTVFINALDRAHTFDAYDRGHRGGAVLVDLHGLAQQKSPNPNFQPPTPKGPWDLALWSLGV
jgi:hypothetical protein